MERLFDSPDVLPHRKPTWFSSICEGYFMWKDHHRIFELGRPFDGLLYRNTIWRSSLGEDLMLMLMEGLSDDFLIERHSDSLLYRMIFHMERPSDGLLYGKTIRWSSIWEDHLSAFYKERPYDGLQYMGRPSYGLSYMGRPSNGLPYMGRPSNGLLYGKTIWGSSIWEDDRRVFYVGIQSDGLLSGLVYGKTHPRVFYMGWPSDGFLYGKTTRQSSIWKNHPIVFYMERPSNDLLYGKTIWWYFKWEDHSMVFYMKRIYNGLRYGKTL